MSERQMSATLDGIRPDHYSRYKFASKRIPNERRVLDAGCGCGYGCGVLTADHKRVVGVDIDKEAIDFAKQHYAGPGYTCADLMIKPWVGQFDAIVNFENIEHMADAPGLLKLFRESMHGQLFISTPNEEVLPFSAENFKDDKYPHLRHYTPDQFTALLTDSGFEVVERWCQKTKGGDMVEGTDGRTLVYVCQ